jgi:hypothetical protein
MHTLFDFITHIKGIEYLLAILFIAGFIVLWEVLKPKPFKTVVETGREDLNFIRKEGVGYFIRGIGKLMAAPFIGLAYVIFLPIGFIAMFCYAVFKGIVGAAGKSVSFGWRPAEAYLGGSKKAKTKKTKSGQSKEK